LSASLNGGPLSFEFVIETENGFAQLDTIESRMAKFGEDQERKFTASLRAVEAYQSAVLGLAPAFTSLDKATTGSLANFARLQSELRKLSAEQNALTEKLQGGNISKEAFTASMSLIVAQEKELVAALAKASEELQRNDSIMKSVSATFTQNQGKLEGLKQAYAGLFDNQKTGLVGQQLAAEIQAVEKNMAQIRAGFQGFSDDTFAALDAKYKELAALQRQLSTVTGQEAANIPFGKNLVKDMEKLRAEIEALKTDITTVPQVNLGPLETKTKQLEALQAKFQSLSQLDLKNIEVAGNIEKLEAEIGQIKASLQNVPALTVEGLVETTAELYRLRQEYEALSDIDKKDVNIGGKLAAQLEGAESRLQTLKAAITGIPEIKLGSFNEKSAEIARLTALLKDLPEIELNDENIGGAMIKQVQQLEAELDQINAKFNAIPQDAFGSINAKAAQLAKLKNEYAALSEIDRRNATVGLQMKKNINELEREVRSLNQEFNQTESFVRKASAAVGAYFSLQAGTTFLKDMASVRGEFQRLEITFTTLLKNKGRADKLMADITKLAATTPFELKDVAAGAKQLLALGVAAEDVTELLRRMGDIAAAGGVDIDRIIRAYGQVKSLGRVRNEELLQLAEAGIPIYQEMAKVLGVAEDKVGELVNTGKVGFKDLHQVVVNMTDAGGSFGGLMEEQAKGIAGLTSNFSDAWAQMLNSMGKDNEGAIAGSIQGATALVEHYQTVLDILKVAVVTYGSYRAAVMLTTVAQQAQLSVALAQGTATARLTTLQAVQAVVTGKLRAAWALLNTTMLANPFVAAATGVAALVAILSVLSDEVDEAGQAQQAFDEIRGESAKATVQQKEELKELLKVAKDETLTLSQREQALKKINSLSPQYLGNLDLAKLKTQQGTDAINAYTAALDLQALKQAAFDKKVELEKKKLDLKSQNPEDVISFTERTAANFRTGKTGKFNEAEYKKVVDEKVREIEEQIEALDKSAKEEQAAYQRLIDKVKDKDSAPLTNRQRVDKAQDLATVKELVTEFNKAYETATTDAARKTLAADLDYAKKREEFLNQYLDKYKGTKKEESRIDADRVRFLEELTRAEQEASRKSLSQSAAETQAAKEKFEALRKEAQKLKLGGGVVTRIDRLEVSELGRISFEDETEKLKEELDRQKEIYLSYEEFREKVSQEKAEERFAHEKAAFADYGKLIESEIAQIAGQGIPTPDLSAGMQARLLMLQARLEEFNKTERAKRDQQYAEAYQATLSFEQKKAAIIAKYAKQADALRQGPITDDYVERLRLLEENQQKEIDAEKDGAFQKTEVYRRLNEQIIEYTRRQVQVRIKMLRELLAQDGLDEKLRDRLEKDLAAAEARLNRTGLKGYGVDLQRQKRERLEAMTPAISKQQQEAYERQLEEINAKIADLPAERFARLAEDLGTVSGMFQSLSGAVGDLNPKLSDTLATMGELTSIGAEAAGAVAAAMAGDIAGVIGGVVKVITGVINYVRGLKQAKEDARKEVEEFQFNAYQGELEINALYRERERTQSRINQARLDALKEEADILRKQAKDNQAEAARVLESLYQQEYIARQIRIHGTWFRKERIENVMASLQGKSFEEIERLNAEGKLTEEAQKWYLELKKLVDEGVDIERLLAENLQARKALFTAISKEGIADAITQGFREGKRTAADFAASFEEMMLNAILNSFKYGIVEKELATFYKMFEDMAFSDERLTEEEIKELKLLYEELIGGFAQKFEELEKITGKSLSDPLKEATGRSSNSLSDAIRDGFKAGKRYISEFSETLEDHLRSAVLDALAMEFLAGPIAQMAGQLQADIKDDGGLSKEEMEAFSSSVNTAIEQAAAAIKATEAALGISLSNPNGKDSRNSIKGDIKAISEQTATVLAGQLGGMRLAQLETNQLLRSGLHLNLSALSVNFTSPELLNIGQQQISLMREKIGYLARIETNTHNTVLAVNSQTKVLQATTTTLENRLRSMERKIEAGSLSASAIGVRG
jgi:tape measure domain-containing protein